MYMYPTEIGVGYGSPERPSNRRAFPERPINWLPSRFESVDESRPEISSSSAPSNTGVARFVPGAPFSAPISLR
jgi:hypothetical protein